MKKYPELKGAAAKVPLSYNPAKKKLIYYKDVVDGSEKIIMPDELTETEKKDLVIQRLKAQPETVFADLNGNRLTKNDLINEIEKNQGYGKSYYEADISYLSDFLKNFK